MKIKDLFTFIFYSEDTMSERSANIITHDPFGSLLGYAPGGVAIYSSDYNTADDKEFPNDAAFRSYLGREYMGYKWQCVEFARRYLYLNHGVVFADVGMAYEIFSLRFLRQVVNDASFTTFLAKSSLSDDYWSFRFLYE